MNDTWLILDCPFLAHRAQMSMGELHYEGEETTIVFGLMRDLVNWKEVFRTRRVVFCFDRGRNKRLELYPEYKANRLDGSEEERERRISLKRQITRLMETDLFRLGYRNVLWEEGYEADDIIASVVLSSIPEGDEVVIVSSDSDLYQLISSTVSIFDPRTNKRRTLQWFFGKYGIEPSQWADVKALAGCIGDNIIGVKTVGEKSAIAFLQGRMPSTAKRYQAIVSNSDLWRRNMRLVQLPFEGCPVFNLRKDQVSKERWHRFCEDFGIKSLKGIYPGG